MLVPLVLLLLFAGTYATTNDGQRVVLEPTGHGLSAAPPGWEEVAVPSGELARWFPVHLTFALKRGSTQVIHVTLTSPTPMFRFVVWSASLPPLLKHG